MACETQTFLDLKIQFLTPAVCPIYFLDIFYQLNPFSIKSFTIRKQICQIQKLGWRNSFCFSLLGKKYLRTLKTAKLIITFQFKESAEQLLQKCSNKSIDISINNAVAFLLRKKERRRQQRRRRVRLISEQCISQLEPEAKTETTK